MIELIVIVFVTSLLIGWVLNILALRITSRWKVLSKFDQAKSREISRLGGVAIFISFLIPLIYFGSAYIVFNLKVWSLIGTMLLIFLLGLGDDIKELNPWVKLTGQIIVVSFLIFAGLKTKIIMVSPLINVLITFLWIVGITNAINLLDILDGLAAGLVAVSGLAFLVIAWLTSDILVAILTASLLGSTLSFLKFNFPLARIYMGDMGSGFLGFTLAVVAILLSYATPEHKLALLVPLFVLGLPIVDLAFVVFRRLSKRKSIIRKSKDHFVLYLIQQKYSLKRTIFTMYLISILFAVSAVLVLKVSDVLGIIIAVIAVSICLAMAYKFRRTNINVS
jgi:UDP-GlcNAc:undecaprenyl-phosphate GlcNAc-1-phosphate transferase